MTAYSRSVKVCVLRPTHNVKCVRSCCSRASTSCKCIWGPVGAIRRYSGLCEPTGAKTLRT
eukprot:1181538-Prorocentrum_minimum.AAC.3